MMICTVGYTLEEALGRHEERPLIVVSKEVVAAPKDVILVVPSKEAFKRVAWKHVFKEWIFDVAPGICRDLEYFFQGVRYSALEYGDLNFLKEKHFLHNAPRIATSKKGEALKGAFRGKCALVLGAGPSLERFLPHIKKLKERCLLFASGTTLNVLAKEGIEPHFAASLDPYTPEARLKEQAAVKCPFFFQSRISPKLLQAVTGETLFVGEEHFFPFERWLHVLAGTGASHFDSGWNGATFCLSLALHMGCNPIYMAGIDLAASGDQVYASSVAVAEGEGELVESESGERQRADWRFAREWIEELKALHPEVEFIELSQEWEKLEPQTFDVHSKVLELPYVDCDPEALYTVLAGQVETASQLIQEMVKKMEEAHPHAANLDAEKRRLTSLGIHEHLLAPYWQLYRGELIGLGNAGQLGEVLFMQQQVLAVAAILSELVSKSAQANA